MIPWVCTKAQTVHIDCNYWWATSEWEKVQETKYIRIEEYIEYNVHLMQSKNSTFTLLQTYKNIAIQSWKKKKKQKVKKDLQITKFKTAFFFFFFGILSLCLLHTYKRKEKKYRRGNCKNVITRDKGERRKYVSICTSLTFFEFEQKGEPPGWLVWMKRPRRSLRDPDSIACDVLCVRTARPLPALLLQLHPSLKHQWVSRSWKTALGRWHRTIKFMLLACFKPLAKSKTTDSP